MLSKISAAQKWIGFQINGMVRLVITASILLGLAVPVYAHHPSGGKISTTFFEGFWSGLGHPVIGIDHLIFVIAIGLLASTVTQGAWIPVAFSLAAMAGTGLHLMGLDLPWAEIFISTSLLISGIFLAKLEKPSTAIISLLAGVAGLFHGYAYGEAIIGATAVPLTAYLIGFTLIQAIIAMGAYKIAIAMKQSSAGDSNFLRFAGFMIMGSGMTFLASSF